MEEENLKLRAEMSHIKTETIDLEDREKELVTDALRQLNDANSHINKVTAQLEKKTDECVAQQVRVMRCDPYCTGSLQGGVCYHTE